MDSSTDGEDTAKKKGGGAVFILVPIIALILLVLLVLLYLGVIPQLSEMYDFNLWNSMVLFFLIFLFVVLLLAVPSRSGASEEEVAPNVDLPKSTVKVTGESSPPEKKVFKRKKVEETFEEAPDVPIFEVEDDEPEDTRMTEDGKEILEYPKESQEGIWDGTLIDVDAKRVLKVKHKIVDEAYLVE